MSTYTQFHFKVTIHVTSQKSMLKLAETKHQQIILGKFSKLENKNSKHKFTSILVNKHNLNIFI